MFFSTYFEPKHKQLAAKLDFWTGVAAVVYALVAAAAHGVLWPMVIGCAIIAGADALAAAGMGLMCLADKVNEELVGAPGLLACIFSVGVAFEGAFYGVKGGEIMGAWRVVAGFALLFVYLQLVTIAVRIGEKYEKDKRK